MAIETLGEAWNFSWRVYMRCIRARNEAVKHQKHSCDFAAELDLETLVCTRGRAFPLSMLQTRLKCPRCGTSHISVLYQPPGGMQHQQRSAS